MHRLVVNVGADALRDVETISLRFGRLSEVLLFIANEVLGASHNTGVLDTLNRRSN